MKTYQKLIISALIFFSTLSPCRAREKYEKFKPVPPTEQEIAAEFDNIVGIDEQIKSDITPIALNCGSEMELITALYKAIKCGGDWGITYSQDSSEKGYVRTAREVYRDRKGDCNELSSLLYGTYIYAVSTLYDKDPDIRPCFVFATIFQQLPDDYQYDPWLTETDDLVTNEKGQTGILRYHLYFALMSSQSRHGWEKRDEPDLGGTVYIRPFDPTTDFENGHAPACFFDETELLTDRRQAITIFYQDTMASAVKIKDGKRFSEYFKKYRKFKE